jgi:hypothetical protein
MADEVADSSATLNDVTDRGVPYRRMGDSLPTADRPYLAAFSSVPGGAGGHFSSFCFCAQAR